MLAKPRLNSSSASRSPATERPLAPSCVAKMQSHLATRPHDCVALSNCGVVSWRFGEEALVGSLRRLAQVWRGTRSLLPTPGRGKVSPRATTLRALPIAVQMSEIFSGAAKKAEDLARH